MTINGDYVKILKRGVPGAFTTHLPRKPYIVGIDAQQKLMCPSGIKSWRRFIDVMFTSVVDKAFGMGAQIVVVSFDDYRYTPSAKHETQRRRDQSLPDFKFAQHDSLPKNVPENFNGAMRNRQFKSKVIFTVIANLRYDFQKRFLQEPALAGRSLVLKFLRTEVVGAPIDIPAAFAAPTKDNEAAVCKTGENDITLPLWIPTPSKGPLLIISTDGDFVPISMIQMERTGGDILLYRLTTNVGTPSTQHTHEFVAVGDLIPFVRQEFPTVNPVSDFATLVALTGCDFCMNLPRVGPARLWAMRSLFTGLDLQSDLHLLMVIVTVYQDLFKKHTRVSRTRVSEMLDFVKQNQVDDADTKVGGLYREIQQHVQNAPKLSTGTRDSVWVYSRALAHCRNALWTRVYWERLHEYPDPLDAGGAPYGFELNDRGWTQWRR